jgi:membrane protein YdbS with pleckstrin-like domain
MQSKTLSPSPKYLTKLWLGFTLLAALILVGALVVGALVGLDRNVGMRGVVTAFLVTAAIDIVWWVPAMVLAAPYYRSLRYEIQEDEVIVHAGIVTRSVKHVPYRTVTNLTVKRDPLDRWFFGLGTLKIQTAGMSGQTGAEESLVGLVNVQEVYELVATELRRFRGSMAPTAAEVEAEPGREPPEVLHAILAEVRSIRQRLESSGQDNTREQGN